MLFLIIYLFILSADERITFCTLGPLHVKESLLLSQPLFRNQATAAARPVQKREG